MQVDYFALARKGRITALETKRQQPELPGLGTVTSVEASGDPVFLEEYRVRETEPEVDLSFFRTQLR
ncbi:MAG: hypothetical protein AAGF53_01855 [Pseudomonadota bacterium]